MPSVRLKQGPLHPATRGMSSSGMTIGPTDERQQGAAPVHTRMKSLRVSDWWFMVGALMALAVITLQGGIRGEVMQAQGSVWELNLEILRLDSAVAD